MVVVQVSVHAGPVPFKWNARPEGTRYKGPIVGAIHISVPVRISGCRKRWAPMGIDVDSANSAGAVVVAPGNPVFVRVGKGIAYCAITVVNPVCRVAYFWLPAIQAPVYLRVTARALMWDRATRIFAFLKNHDTGRCVGTSIETVDHAVRIRVTCVLDHTASADARCAFVAVAGASVGATGHAVRIGVLGAARAVAQVETADRLADVARHVIPASPVVARVEAARSLERATFGVHVRSDERAWATVAGVAYAVRVPVRGLFRVEMVGAVVRISAVAIGVGIIVWIVGTGVAQVADLVVIAIELVRVNITRTIVTRVAPRVGVDIALILIG